MISFAQLAAALERFVARQRGEAAPAPIVETQPDPHAIPPDEYTAEETQAAAHVMMREDVSQEIDIGDVLEEEEA